MWAVAPAWYGNAAFVGRECCALSWKEIVWVSHGIDFGDICAKVKKVMSKYKTKKKKGKKKKLMVITKWK